MLQSTIGSERESRQTPHVPACRKFNHQPTDHCRLTEHLNEAARASKNLGKGKTCYVVRTYQCGPRHPETTFKCQISRRREPPTRGRSGEPVPVDASLSTDNIQGSCFRAESACSRQERIDLHSADNFMQNFIHYPLPAPGAALSPDPDFSQSDFRIQSPRPNVTVVPAPPRRAGNRFPDIQ